MHATVREFSRRIILHHESAGKHGWFLIGIAVAERFGEMLPQLRLSQSSTDYSVGRVITRPKTVFDLAVGPLTTVGNGVKRRWLRERRRRKVGRAYDMALEIARVVPRGSEVLDVGCGNGYIAHHLSAMLGTTVTGIDVANSTDAPIDYRQYDGREFPAANASFDAIVLAYVLHHAPDVHSIVEEMKRVLRPDGLAIIYEDIPATAWDRFLCWTHDLKWRKRTGACTFRSELDWLNVFESAGFQIIRERQLSRLRNLMHPVCRRFFLVQNQPVQLAVIAEISCAQAARPANPRSQSQRNKLLS